MHLMILIEEALMVIIVWLTSAIHLQEQESIYKIEEKASNSLLLIEQL